MLFIPDYTRGYRIVELEYYSAHLEMLSKFMTALEDSDVKSLLSVEELMLIEIAFSIDEKVLTEDIKYKMKVLHRFLISLPKIKHIYGIAV